MYILIVLVLIVSSIIELASKRSFAAWYRFLFIFLTVLLAFRYGQGTDYYGYYLQYQAINPNGSIIYNQLYHGEMGWYVLLFSLKKIGMSFDLIVITLSCIMMLFLSRCIGKYSHYPITSLTLLYPTFYLTYCFSAIRQALVICTFLGFGVEMLVEKRVRDFLILAVALSFIHRSALILFMLPFLIYFRKEKLDKLFIIIVFLGVTLSYFGLLDRIILLFDIQDYYLEKVSVSAIIYRVILFIIIRRLHNYNFNSNRSTETENLLFMLYSFGFFLYLSLFASAVLSQRLTASIKAIEIILLPLIVHNMRNTSNDGYNNSVVFVTYGKTVLPLGILIVIQIVLVETIKNINSYIIQGNYYEWVNVINYPYSHIFDKTKIFKYISHFAGYIE